MTLLALTERKLSHGSIKMHVATFSNTNFPRKLKDEWSGIQTGHHITTPTCSSVFFYVTIERKQSNRTVILTKLNMKLLM